MSFRFVRSPDAPKMTTEQGSARPGALAAVSRRGFARAGAAVDMRASANARELGSLALDSGQQVGERLRERLHSLVEELLADVLHQDSGRRQLRHRLLGGAHVL